MDKNASQQHPTIGRASGRPLGSAALRAALIGAAALASAAVVRCCRRTARLAEQTRRLETQARTDPLTGLANRLDVEERLLAAGSAARRHQQPLSVLFIDLDSFKHINDAFGYEAGDEVLRTAADRLRATIRAEDVVGRWGGEEFLAILPATDRDGAVAVAERLRRSLNCGTIAVAERDVPVTISVGCASGVCEPAELVRQASSALRQAKRAGKNRVVAAHDPHR